MKEGKKIIRIINSKKQFKVVHSSPDRTLIQDQATEKEALIHIIQSKLPVTATYLTKRFKAWNKYQSRIIETHIAITAVSVKRKLLQNPDLIPYLYSFAIVVQELYS